MKKITVRQGSSFVWTATLKRLGAPYSVDSLTISSQIRSEDDVLLASLSVNKLAGQTGKFTLSGSATGWAPGVYYCDIKYVSGSDASFSERFVVAVERSVTA